MWVAIAAVGCALAVVGLFLISGDAQAGDSGDDGSNVPGHHPVACSSCWPATR